MDKIYLAWPRIKVAYYEQQTQYAIKRTFQREAIKWLRNNQVLYHMTVSSTYRYYYLYIQDNKYLTMFMLKFGDLVVND